MKKIILITAGVAIISLVVFNVFIKDKKADFILIEVVKGNVIQEVFETGQVKMGKPINLGFKNAGTLQTLFVKVGDNVWPGSLLAKLDAVQLMIERAEAQAALDVAQAKFDQLLEGSTPEEIQAAQTDVDNAKMALEDAKSQYEEDLNHAYEDALNTLDSAYLKSSGALNTVSTLKKTYFYGGDQESTSVNAEKTAIEMLVNTLKTQINEIHALSSNQKIDNTIITAKNNLNNIYTALNVIRDMTETVNYTSVVSTADKTSLNTERANINTALSSIISAQQTISSTKIDGQADLNTAQGNLAEAQDDLNLKLAKPSQATIDLYRAQVEQAKASRDLLDNKISESTLKSPVQGKVIKISKELGETVQPSLSESVITLLPANPYEIEADIYEEDIVKMSIDNPVEISLIAFPDQSFQGRVIAINPAEELVEGVVYYTVTIDFETVPEGIKPGMTADLAIKVASKENIPVVPEDAVFEKDNKRMVKVSENNKITEREISTGLEGTEGYIEIISGLAEGEKVVIE